MPRVWIAFRLPNPDGDAYAYLETIERMRAGLVASTFSAKTLFSFWLPLYQFICALISVLTNHPVYVSKLVSAVCGTGVCLLVFLITFRLTTNRRVALAVALLAALNPLHMLYSAFSMTEIPHALLVMGSLYAAITNRWAAAAVCAALAGFMRVESWMLIGLLPALEYFARRRITIGGCGVLLIAPLAWLYICWAATGDALAYFHDRSRYIDYAVAAYPQLKTLSLARLRLNGLKLIHSANPLVLLGSLMGSGWLIRQKLGSQPQAQAENRFAVGAVAVFFFAYLGFLLSAFLTGNQPDIWDRYGLIFFTTGLPLAAWTYQQITREKPRLAAGLAALILLVCLSEVYSQVRDADTLIRQTSAQQIIANNLQHIYAADANIRILSDDPALPALTQIPPDRFIPLTGLPLEPEGLLTELDKRGIDYIVYQRDSAGSLISIFPELKNGLTNKHFELVIPSFPQDWHGNVYVYKLRRAVTKAP